MEYEICYLIGESKEAEAEKIKKDVEKTINSKGGSFSGIEFVDRRKMAYAIRKEIRGTYVARRFKLSNKDEKEDSTSNSKEILLADIIEKLNLNQDILRFKIVKVDTLPPLKTREEIEKEAGKMKVGEPRGKRSGKIKEKRPIAQKKPPVVKKKERESKTESQNDIDKKLEEILNI